MTPSGRSEYSLQKQRLVMHTSIATALLLSLYPYGLGYQVYAPDWLGIIILYWLWRNGPGLGYWHIFLYGVFFDLLHFNFIGAESVGLLILGYCYLRYRMFFQFLPYISQLLAVLLLLFIKQFCIQWILGITGEMPSAESYLVAPLIGVALWIVISRMPLDGARRRRRL